jgi:CDP-diacylglycerol--glycerol-3-phosphate 3-phosphatidyltransferase
MNLPNKLTVVRMCLVPVILLIGFLTPKCSDSLWFYISSAICAAVFIGASVTDMLDGKIARRDNLVTDFGKFMDPVADKFMVIGALFVILYKFPHLQMLMLITLIIVVFRELAVTSMRLVVASGKNIVVAANILGKVKTVSQIVAISTIFLEPVVQYVARLIVGAIVGEAQVWPAVIPLTWASVIFSLVMTVWSGVNYLAAYWKYIDTDK